MTEEFKGRVVVVTGGNSGIGLETARAFRARGAKVVVTGRDEKTLKGIEGELGGEGVALRSEASSLEDVKRLVEVVRERYGRIDVLFVNAGVAKFAPVSEVSPEFFDETIGINLRGAYFLIREALPLMKEGASIILNGSTVVDLGMPGASVYTASKAALASLAKSLGAELAGQGIRVNVVNPGPIATPIFDRMGVPKEATDQIAEGLRSQVPLKRLGRPEEIASAVLYLAGAEYVTGTELFVDGGMSRL